MFKKLNDFTPHMTHVKPNPIVKIGFYLTDIQFGKELILFMFILVKYITK